MSEGEQTYGSISLIGRGAPAPGAVRLDRDKISWKKTGGGRAVDVGADEIEAMTYAQVPGGVVVTVRRRGDKDAVRLKGFRGSDLAGLKDLCSAFYGVALAKTEAQINGRNWGEVSVNKSAIGFAVDGKDAFEVATKDIAAVSLATKHEVVMEFHLDDVAQQSSKDALVEMSFYVPPTSNEWGVAEDSNVNEDEDERTGAKNLQDAILAVADVAADTGTPIAEFESVSLIAPRGKVAVELHAQFMRLTGAAADFKINYAALQRVFLLPKPNSAQTYAVMHLDPPIRKGQTFYAHIVAQFNQNEELEIEPDADDLKARFEKLEDRTRARAGRCSFASSRPSRVANSRARARSRPRTAATRSRRATRRRSVTCSPWRNPSSTSPSPDVGALRGRRVRGVRAAQRAARRRDAAHVRRRRVHARGRDAHVPRHSQERVPEPGQFLNREKFEDFQRRRQRARGCAHRRRRRGGPPRAAFKGGGGRGRARRIGLGGGRGFRRGGRERRRGAHGRVESESGSGDESDGSDAPAKKKAKKSKASPAGKKAERKRRRRRIRTRRSGR